MHDYCLTCRKPSWRHEHADHPVLSLFAKEEGNA